MNNQSYKNTSASSYVWLQIYYRILSFLENFKCNPQVPKEILVLAVITLVSDVTINRTQANDAFAFLFAKLGLFVFSFVASAVLILKYSDAFKSRKYYDAFISIGFVNSIGITPILIKQVKTANTMTIVFDNVGISLCEWENRKAEIESILNISIALIKIGDTNRQIIINARIGKFDYANTLYWNTRNNYKQNDSLLCLGESMFNSVVVSLNDYPHFLIGGATGSGKTLLLKLILMQCINNGFIVNIADFKGGVDFGRIWENHCTFVTDIPNTTKKLDEIIAELENRKKIYAKNGYKNISDYNKHELIKHKRIIFASDCRQSPGICRDFYYEHCFSGIIKLSERRCFL